MVDAKTRSNEVATPNGSTETPISISNQYVGYSDTLELYKRKAKECPKGVRLKLQKQKFLMVQFPDPVTGKVTVRASGEPFTDEGIINAVSKCHDISKALKRFETSGDFWAWFDLEILGKREVTDNLRTYQQIFEQLETDYYNGKHKNTKRKRSRDIPNDVYSFRDVYGCVFNRFPVWDKYPEVNDFKGVVSSVPEGTKRFKDMGSILRKIAELSHDSKRICEYLATVDFKQSVFAEKQSIDYNTFVNWYRATKPNLVNKSLPWLWVTGICVAYGLRPTEIMACQNIATSHTVDGVTFKPITDPNNREKLLYLGEFTTIGTSIKTGSRICKPLVNAMVWDELELNDYPGLPSITSVNPKMFVKTYRDFLINHGCPVTQAYAFRHLANQLGELNGIPQEIRSRSLGHSVSINESVYKKRSNTKTTVDLLTSHSKQPIPLAMARDTLDRLGIDTNDPNVNLILRVVYQIE